ncbi:MAG TPA: ABC-type transport auxiliary lipoprotein family protein [Candidatus Hydrogenedentes bacterium]|nr:ABC-type transport auxiliary lipoprotein family protein [Candidatus Hydrogenedentota bacterium]
MMWSRARRMRLLTMLAIGTVTLVITGCLGPKTIMEYREHALWLDTKVSPSAGQLPWTVGVRPITAGKAVDQRMAYLDADGVVRRYPDDGWAEPPAAVVYRGLVDALRHSETFADVDNVADMVRPDILVHGELRECVADFSTDPPVARVTLSISARVYRDRFLALGHVISKAVPIAMDPVDSDRREEPLRVAQALREAMRQVVAEAAGLIVDQAAAWSKQAASETGKETTR